MTDGIRLDFDDDDNAQIQAPPRDINIPICMGQRCKYAEFRIDAGCYDQLWCTATDEAVFSDIYYAQRNCPKDRWFIPYSQMAQRERLLPSTWAPTQVQGNTISTHESKFNTKPE